MDVTLDFSPTKSNSRNDSLLFVRGVVREKGTTTNVYENVINVLLLEHILLLSIIKTVHGM